MTDLTRPVAPFLAPEIISGIFNYYLPESSRNERSPATQRGWATSVKRFSLVSSDWSNETRGRIFSHVCLTSARRLDNFLGLMDKFVGEAIQSLEFRMTVTETGKLSRIIKFTPNLRILALPSLLKINLICETFSLSKLTTLVLRGDSAAYLAVENLKIIITSAPKLESLIVNGTLKSMRSRAFSPHTQAWSTFPLNLKKLEIRNDASAVMTGALLPLDNLSSIEHLRLDSYLTPCYEPFFESIGSSLISLVCPVGGLEPFLGHLTELVELRLKNPTPTTLNFSSNFQSKLPRKLTKLDVHLFYGISKFSERYSTSSTSKQQLNLELLKLDTVRSRGVDINTLNLAHLPTTKSLQILDYTYRENHFEESLNQLKIEEVKFEKLIVSKGSFDNDNIKTRCETLGIQLEQGDEF